MDRIRVQRGYPIVEEADYKGHRIKVVCGYNIMRDNYVVHVYISPPSGPEVRVFDPPREENTEDDALNLGFFSARSEIDQIVPGS